jgi:ankyrin repeat protein
MEAIVLNNGGKKQQEKIKLLIEHGADMNIPDSEGVTPLQHVNERNFAAIEKILLQAVAKR